MNNLELIQIYDITTTRLCSPEYINESLYDRLDDFLKKVVQELEARVKSQSIELMSDILPLLKRKMGPRSCRECAKEIGISHATLSRIILGRNPDLRSLSKIKTWLDLGSLGDES